MKDYLAKHQIECRGISLSYDGHTVLENVSFFVDSGDYLCIVGENGSGKSTLLKIIAGVIPCDGYLSVPQRVLYMPQKTVLFDIDRRGVNDHNAEGECRRQIKRG